MNAKWPNLNFSIRDLAHSLNEGNVPTKRKCVKKVEAQTRPQVEVLKFNTDWALRGYPGESGTGGILRNENRDTFTFFSKAIEVAHASKAELTVVNEVALFFVVSRWNTTFSLLLECDSSNVARWIKKLNYVPWKSRALVIQTLKLLNNVLSWDVRHIL